MNRFVVVATSALFCVMIPTALRAQGQLPAGDVSPEFAQGDAPATAPGPTQAETREPKHIQIDLNIVLAQARAAMREGKFDEAVKLYQLILHFLPENRVVRIELSFALAALGQRERAARLLRDIDRDGLDPEVITTIDRIVGPGPVTFFVIPEIIIDTNINGRTKKNVIRIGNTLVQLNEDAQGREAYGFGLTVGAAYRVLDEAPRTTLTAGVRVRDVQARQDDTVDVFGALSLGFDFGERTSLIPSLSGVYRTQAGDPYELEGSGALSLGFDVASVRTTLTGRYRHVQGEGDNDGIRDRERQEASTSFGYGFPGLGLRFDGGVFREDWRVTETQDNEGFSSGLDIIFAKTPVVMPTIGGGFIYTHYENEEPFFNVRRLDREYEGHIELLFRDVNLFGTGAPSLRYRYRHVTSNIPLFEFDKHEVSIGIRAITF